MVFGRPAMEVLAGGIWRDPRGYEVVADFKKNKQRGRSEYLRARLNAAGRVDVFPLKARVNFSISWSDGLVEIGFEEELIEPGTVVRYILTQSFETFSVTDP